MIYQTLKTLHFLSGKNLFCNKYQKNYISNRKTTFHSVDLKDKGLFGKEAVIANRFLQKLYQAEQSKQPFLFSVLDHLQNQH